MPHEHSDDDEADIEIEIAFELLPDALQRHGLSVDQVNESLMSALDDREWAVKRGEEPSVIEDMPLVIDGRTYCCGDFFSVAVSGDIFEPEEE